MPAVLIDGRAAAAAVRDRVRQASERFRDRTARRPGLAMVQHIDGFGTRSQKDATLARLRRPKQFHIGYKLFYDEDVRLYQPRDVLRFTPVPDYVSYQ